MDYYESKFKDPFFIDSLLIKFYRWYFNAYQNGNTGSPLIKYIFYWLTLNVDNAIRERDKG